MNLSQYEAFIKTVELGSLTRAAEALGYTQSGVTHLLNSLEEQFGLKLISRNRKGVRLTAYGELLLPEIRSILYQQHILDEHVNELNGLRSGLIRIGTFTSASSELLPGIIRRFRETYPGIRFELLHGTNNENEQWVREGRLDLAFVRIPQAGDLESVFLMDDPIVAVVPGGSDLASMPSVGLSYFESYPYIALSEGVDDEITEIIDHNDIKVNTQFVEKDDHAVLSMIEEGLGISIMPELILRSSSRRVTSLPLDPPGSRKLGIAFKNKENLSASAKEFLKCSVSWVKEQGL